jgi:hypothetical protein
LSLFYGTESIPNYSDAFQNFEECYWDHFFDLIYYLGLCYEIGFGTTFKIEKR